MFNGKMDSVMACTDREKGHAKFRFYDKDWKRLFYMYPELEPNGDVSCPHIRVDLYNIEGQIYFGELTFYNQSGFDTDITYETDCKWGNMTNLNLVRNDGE